MREKRYRNIYASEDIVATGNKHLPKYYCENASIGVLPTTGVDLRFDLVVSGTLNTYDLVYGVKFNHIRLKKILKNL